MSADRQTRFSLKLLYFFSGAALLALLLSVFVQSTIPLLLSLGCVFLVLSALWGYVVFKSQIFSKTSCNVSHPLSTISLLLAIFVNSIIIYFAGRSVVSALLSITNGYANGVWWSSIISSLSLGGVFEFITSVRTPLGWCAAIAFGQLALFILWYLMKNLVMHVIGELRDNHRDYLKRCLSLLFPVSLVAFLYLVYAPYEVFFANPSDMGSLIFTDFWWIFIVAFVCFVLISVLVLSFFTGRVFRWVVCLVFGLGIASYVQMMFLNGGLGILDGNIPSALTDPLQLGVNILIWAVILAIPLVLNHFVPNILDIVVKYGSLIVTVLLLVSVIFMVVTAPVNAFERQDSYYLSAEDQFVLSANDNIVLFVVDYGANGYFDEVSELNPDVLDIFSDFTYYNNANCVYFGTIPSLNHILTGIQFDPSLTIDKWYAESWTSEKANYFYQTLKNEGYVVNIYTSQIVVGVNSMVGKVSNVALSTTDVLVDREGILSSFISNAYYKLFPNIVKINYHSIVSGFDYSYLVRPNSESGKSYTMDNPHFYSKLSEIGLSIKKDDTNLFVVQHVRGIHTPYRTDEYCNVKEGATRIETEQGVIVLLSEYLSQMKELGVYDDATIIITADHGANSDGTRQPVFLIKESGVRKEQLTVNSAPISHEDILPTILDVLGKEYQDIGFSIYDIDEDVQRQRFWYTFNFDTAYPAVPKYQSNAVSSINICRIYSYFGDSSTLDSAVANSDYTVSPLVQGWW